MATANTEYTATLGPTDIALTLAGCAVSITQDGTARYTKTAGGAATVSEVVPTITAGDEDGYYEFTFTPDDNGQWFWSVISADGNYEASETLTVGDSDSAEDDERLTVAQAKARLRITSTAYDDYLLAVIPDLIEWAEAYCNQTWDDELPGGVKQFVCQAAQYFMRDMSVNSKRLGDYGYSVNADELPQSIRDMLRPWKLARFH